MSYSWWTLTLSVLLHLLVLGCLQTTRQTEPIRMVSSKAHAIPLVEAVSIDQAAVMQEVEKIKEARRQQRLKKIREAKKIEHQAIVAKQQLSQIKKQIDTMSKKEEQIKHTIKVSESKQQQLNKRISEQKNQLQQQARQRMRQLAAEKRRKAELALTTLEDSAQSKELDRYKNLVLQTIARYWIIPGNSDREINCTFHIELNDNGDVLSVQLVKSSGDVTLDRSAELAIHKASPLPMPSDKTIASRFKTLKLIMRPEKIIKSI